MQNQETPDWCKVGLASTDILNEDLDKMAGFIVHIYKTLTDAMKGRYPHWAQEASQFMR
jgi:hypothetical protein